MQIIVTVKEFLTSNFNMWLSLWYSNAYMSLHIFFLCGYYILHRFSFNIKPKKQILILSFQVHLDLETSSLKVFKTKILCAFLISCMDTACSFILSVLNFSLVNFIF
jgi:hypothetical protein